MSEQSQANEHRGVALPEGMTPECADELVALFVDYADDLLSVDGELIEPMAVAVMAFQVVQKSLSPLPQNAE